MSDDNEEKRSEIPFSLGSLLKQARENADGPDEVPPAAPAPHAPGRMASPSVTQKSRTPERIFRRSPSGQRRSPPNAYRVRNSSPSRSRSRSRSLSKRRGYSRGSMGRRSRSDSRSRSPYRRKSRSPLGRERSRSPFRRKSQSPRRERLPCPMTNSNDPSLLMARVFVGNLATDRITRPELIEWFAKYGKVIGCSLHKGYGFVQYEEEAIARHAVEAERGSLYKGLKIDVKMAAEGKRGKGNQRRTTPPPRRRSPSNRDRSHSPGGRRSPPRRDPYGRDDPYRRMPDDPYYGRRDPDDGFRRDQHLDPYYDRLSNRDGPPAPCVLEAIVVAMGPHLRDYGCMVEYKIKQLGLVTDFDILGDSDSPHLILESCTKKGVLVGVVINLQNEMHRSLTVNILQGTPQEHRNMPLDDAMELISRTFEQHMRMKTSYKSLGIPPSDISYLLNLLADGRHLTLSELDRVADFVADRRAKAKGENGIQDRERMSPRREDEMRKRDEMQKQQDLQAKILSIINPGSNAPVSVPPPSSNQVTQNINLDNPNIQMALDNLLKSGPIRAPASASGQGIPYSMSQGTYSSNRMMGANTNTTASGNMQYGVSAMSQSNRNEFYPYQ